ncbi:MAG: phosphatidate cytidylyltransferase [Phycisphaerales bacterium]|nr:phosphatidate cytidylyltransferase [Phycisphaerales bacterium]
MPYDAETAATLLDRAENGPRAGRAGEQAKATTAPEPFIYSNTRRKIIHLLPGAIPFIMWFVYHEDPLPLWNLGVVVAVVGLLTAFGVWYPRYVRRGRGENWTLTCVTYAVPPTVVLCLFPAQAEFAAVVLTVLAFGDTAAAMAGKAWGKRRLPWNPRKTVVGLVSFVVVASGMASLAYWGEARNPSVPFSIAMVCGTSAALLGGLAESFPSRLDDNLRISIAAAVGVIVSGFLLA